MWQVGQQFPIGYSGPLLCRDFLLQTLLPKLLKMLGVSGKLITKAFTPLLCCLWKGYAFSHSFPVLLEYPCPLVGRDILN